VGLCRDLLRGALGENATALGMLDISEVVPKVAWQIEPSEPILALFSV